MRQGGALVLNSGVLIFEDEVAAKYIEPFLYLNEGVFILRAVILGS